MPVLIGGLIDAFAGGLGGIGGLLGIGGADAAAAGAGLAGGAETTAAAVGAGTALEGATGLTAGSLDALSATGNLAGFIPASAGGVEAGVGAALPGVTSTALGFAPGGTEQTIDPTLSGFLTNPTAAAGAPVGSAAPGAGAAAVAPLPGAAPSASIADLTSAASSPLDTAAYPAGPIGAPTAGLTPSVSTAGGVSNITGGGAAAGGDTLTADAGSSSGGFLSNLTNSLSPSNILKGVEANPLPALIAAGGLGYNVINGQKQTAAANQLADLAGKEQGTGLALQNYALTGTAPPGETATINQNAASAKAAIIARYAANGENTNPTQNSALQQELAAVDASVPQSTAAVGAQLLSGGTAAVGAGGADLSALIANQSAQSKNVGTAIQNMSAALAGKGGTSVGGFTVSPT